MDRRTFIKLTAVTSTAAALEGCQQPSAPLVRFLPDEDIQPGQEAWKPSVCTLCAAGCGLRVRIMDADTDIVREGRAGVQRILAAKKLEGAPDHPVNHGRLCARGQAGVQVTYHPDRITQPLKRSGPRGSGEYVAIPWDEALATFVAALNDRQAGSGAPTVAWLGTSRRGLRRAFIGAWVGRLGGIGPIDTDPFGDELLRRANAVSFGRPQLPTYDLADARFVLGLGADFLGTWNSPVAQSVAYGAMRRGRRGIRGLFTQVEARMSQTGASADAWLPAHPGSEGALVLALAHVIIAREPARAATAGRAGDAVDGWHEGLPAWTPAAAAAITGVPAARIEQLAGDLLELAPALVVAGGPVLAHTNGFATALAVNALNALIGAVDLSGGPNRPGGLTFTPQIDATKLAALDTGTAMPPPTLGAFVREHLHGPATAPSLVVIDGVNPVHTSPAAWRLRDALVGVPTIISVSAFLDDTSVLADLILPDHTALESWLDAIPESGAADPVISAAAPAVRPLHATRSTVDVLLDVSSQLRSPLAWPWASHEQLVSAAIGTLPADTADGDTWTDVQARGGWWSPAPPATDPVPPPLASWATTAKPAAVAFEAPVFAGEAAEYPLHFLPYASAAFLDGSLAHLPWLQEMPDPLTSAMWSSWVEINPSTAASLGIRDGDVVRLTSPAGTLETAAWLSPGIAPALVAMPAGLGHTMFTRYASGRGANPFSLLAPRREPVTGALAWASTRVRVERVGPPDGRLILFAGGLRAQGDGGHAGRS